MALKLTAADAHAKTIVAGKIIEIASIREISVDALCEPALRQHP